jgi:tetratricopeptide (TPR) repeat protein
MSGLYKKGDIIDQRFKVLRDPLEGGFGTVYICSDKCLEIPVPVVLKTFKLPGLKETTEEMYKSWKEAKNSFLREADIWCRLKRHTNVVTASGILILGNMPFLILEYIHGYNLEKYLNSSTKRDLPILLNLVVQICRGLEFAWRNERIVHADLSPKNILIGKNGVAKVTDFGLSRVIKDIVQEKMIAEKNDFAFTLAYGSPEQLTHVEVNSRSDIYSFGVILYQMLTGINVNLKWIIPTLKIKEKFIEIPRSPKELINKIPDSVDQLVMKCLKLNPGERYESFTEILEVIYRVHIDLFKIPPLGEIEDDIKMEPCYDRTAQVLTAKGDFSEAIKEYENLLKKHPNDSILWNNAGFAMCQNGQHDKAIVFLKKAISINPKESLAYLNMGEAYKDLKKYDKARDAYKQALKIDPDLTNAHFGLAYSLFNLNDAHGAIKAVNRAIELEPNYSQAYYIKALSLMRLSLVDDSVAHLLDVAEEALKCFEKACELDPENTLALFGKAGLLANLGRGEDAKDCIDYWIEVHPENELGWLQKAQICKSLCEQKEAIDCYTNALEINSNSIEALREKGRTLRTLNAYDDALQCLEKAIELNPDSSELWFEKFLILFYTDSIEEADICLQNVQNASEQSTFDNSSLGTEYHRLKEIIQAYSLNSELHEITLELLHTIPYELRNEDSELLAYEAMALNEAGRLDDALFLINKALKFDQRNAMNWTVKGDIIAKQGQSAEAVYCYHKAIIREENDAELYYKMSRELLRQEKYDEAIRYLNKTLTITTKQRKLFERNLQKCFYERKLHEGRYYYKKHDINLHIEANSHKELAIAFEQIGRLEDAIAHYEHLIQMPLEDESKTYFLYNKGILLQKLGKLNGAISAFDESLALNPEDINCRYEKANTLFMASRQRDALYELEQILAIDSENSQAKELIHMINKMGIDTRIVHIRL